MKGSRPLGQDFPTMNDPTSFSGLKPVTPGRAKITKSFGEIAEELEAAHAPPNLALDKTAESLDPGKIELIDIGLIDEPFVRQRWQYSTDKITKMAASLMAEGDGNPLAGQLQPVLLIPSPDTPGRYEMVEGLTRLKAFKDHHLAKQIKAIVRHDLDRSAAYRVGYMANEERNPPSNYDKGMSFAAAIEAGIYTSQANLAETLRLSPSTVTGYLAFSKLPPSVVSIIELNVESFGYNVAARLLALSKKAPLPEVESAARKIAQGTWSFAKLSNYVTEVESGDSKPKRSKKSSRTIRDLGKIRCGDGSLSLVLEGIPSNLEKVLADRLEAIVLEVIGKVAAND